MMENDAEESPLPGNTPIFDAAGATSPGGTITVLVVDDEPSLLRVASAMLAALGYRAVVAADGAEALRMLSVSEGPKIDVLLTDYLMPAMLGDELAKRFREVRPEAGIIMMSGYLPDGVTRLPYHFLAKPFRKEDLGEKLKAVLSV